MYLRRESARKPASTFQAYPRLSGDSRKITGKLLRLVNFDRKKKRKEKEEEGNKKRREQKGKVEIDVYRGLTRDSFSSNPCSNPRGTTWDEVEAVRSIIRSVDREDLDRSQVLFVPWEEISLSLCDASSRVLRGGRVDTAIRKRGGLDRGRVWQGVGRGGRQAA